jgi:uncharacterized protein YndB with AHSA1/START domain
MIRLTLVRRIAARPSIVFDALTTPEGVAHWWGPDGGPVLLSEVDARVGGRFRVRFQMLDGSEHESQGEYLVVEAPFRLKMTWRWVEGGDDSGESFVEFTLRAVGDGTALTLTHSGLETDAARRSHEQGWAGSLDKLNCNFLSAGDLRVSA